MSNVREAAERLRVGSLFPHARTADGRPYFEGDLKLLAGAYLAEHPADESIEVDAEWLVQIGFEPDASGALWIGDRRLCWDRRICWFGNGYFGFDGVELEAKTRGDVRRMLKVFKVEFKE